MIRFASLLLPVLLLAAACQPLTNLPLKGLEQDQAQLDSLLQEIQLLITDKSCGSDGQCAFIAYGQKACGGPVGYLVYSSSQVDVNQLTALVNQYTSLQEDMNEEYGLISDCSAPVEPAPGCVSGNCE